MRTRPLGVSLISGLSLLISFLITPMFLGSFCMLTEFRSDMSGILIRIAMLYHMILSLVVGIGLLELKNWAHEVTVIGFSLSALLNLTLFGLPVTLVGSISFLAPIAAVVYLRQPGIKSRFHQSARDSSAQ